MFNRVYLTVGISLMILIISPFLQSAEGSLSPGQEEILKDLPADLQVSVKQKMLQQTQLSNELDAVTKEGITRTTRPERKELTDKEKERAENFIYGYDLFASSPTTFAPATDIPVPLDYVLGPGDMLSINIFGGSSTIEQVDIKIKRNGTIEIPGISAIGIGGLTLEEARKLVNIRVGAEFLGATTTISVTEFRSMKIFVLGDAYQPGSFTVSSLTTISNAMYVSGGVSEKGSLRNIQLKRNGEVIQTYDLYDLLLKGDTSKDVRLRPGDVLFIPILKNKVRIQGAVRRPALYEIKEGTTLANVIELAAGLKSESLPSASELNRVNRSAGIREILNIDVQSKEVLSMTMQDGDIVNIPSITALDEINIELTGQFKYPGTYSVKNGEKLSHLLARAGGFAESAYLYGAIFTRRSVANIENAAFRRAADELETALATGVIAGRTKGEGISELGELITRMRQTESPGRLIVDIDPINIAADPEKDFYLENGDRLHIPKRANSVTVVGDVFSPTTLPFKNSYKVKDYVEQSGGLKWGADKGSIFLVLPDGQSRATKSGIWRKSRNYIAPGTTIVVPKSMRPFDWIMLAESVTPVLANFTVAAASLAAIND